MEYILKATLIVASISSLNAGYWENAKSFASSFKNTASETAKSLSTKASGVAQTLGTKAQSMTASGLTFAKQCGTQAQFVAGAGLKSAQAVAKKAVESTVNGAGNLKTQAGTYANQFAQAAGSKITQTREYLTSEPFKQQARDVFAKMNSTEGRKYIAGSVVVLGGTYAAYKWLRKPSKKAIAELEVQQIAEQLNAASPEQRIDGEQKTSLTSEQLIDNAVRKLNITVLTESEIKDRETIINFLKTLPTNLFEKDEFVELYIKHPGILPQLDFFKDQLTETQFEQLDKLVEQYRLLMGY